MCNRTLVMNRIEECYARAERAFTRTFDRPRVRFDKRGQVAGTADHRKNELNFNMVLLNENLEHFVMQTVAHEIAHLVTGKVYPDTRGGFDRFGKRTKRRSHGREWKSVMIMLGVNPDRCHTYDVTNAKVGAKRKTVTFDYKCSGCGSVLPMGKVRHNKFQAGKAKYSHCRGTALTLVG